MRRQKLIYSAYLLTVSCLVMAMPAKSKPEWQTYRLNVKNVYACAFTPNDQAVAFVHLTDLVLSDNPWKAVYTAHLGVWDFTTGNIEEKFKWNYTDQGKHDPWSVDPRYLKFTTDGHRLILFDSNEISVFEVPSYKLETQVPFSRPSEKTSLRGMQWNIVGFSATPNGSRVAVAVSDPGNAGGGFVRVYDLPSGKVVREWPLSGEVKGVAGIALSPDGDRVAVSWLPSEGSSDPEAFIPSGTDNVRVMDVKTGETLAGLNTKYFAGPVLFGPNDTLLTGSTNDDRTGYKYDSIKVWDARTGKLLREIIDPRTGVHYRLDLSPDGKLLLGYTGTEKPVENFVNIDSQQFQIWDFASGKVVASSPKILPANTIGPPPEMRISASGKFVLVWWGNGFAKPFVYAVP